MLVRASIFISLPYLFQAVMVIREHSLSGPYAAGGENLAHWDLFGSAQLGGGYIRLTDEINKQGAIWNNLPTYPNNWELQMQFNIHGNSDVNGDGMAVWYVSGADRLKHGSVFGSKDFFSGIGVFIDTKVNQAEPFQQQHHPYISAMVNNGSLHYEHGEDGTFTQIGGCHAFVKNLLLPSRIAISYTNNNLAVYLDNEGTFQWKLCFIAEEVYLPTGYYLGVSASTRDNSDNHDVISITFLNLDPENGEWIEKNNIIPRAKNVQTPTKKYHKVDLQKIKEKEMDEDEEEEEDEVVKEEDEIEKQEEEIEMEEASSSTSLLRILVYIIGAALIILIFISTARKYIERRRERMHKRLF